MSLKISRFEKTSLLLRCWHDSLLIQKPEVISLRTSGKRLPGKKLAVYNGAVIAVLLLAYNLIKDFSFILISDKEGILKLCFVKFKYQTDDIPWKICIVFGNSFSDRFSLRISLILVLIGVSGLCFEIINAFEYLQGARKGFCKF